jgi:uncharacterized protein (DUF362 family)
VEGEVDTRQRHGNRAFVDELGPDPEATLRRGLEFIRWDEYVTSNTHVFVKPNFTFPHYVQGVTTSPDFLRHLLGMLKSRAGKVTVGESNGGNNSFSADDAFQGHNMFEICRETGADLVNLSSLPSETIESEVLGKKVKVQLPRILLEDVDCFVSAPVLKVHVITTVSLSLKNSWGCVPDTMRGLTHHNLSYKLALIARLLKPRIVVVDGTYGLNKHGPMFGEPVQMNLVLTANNTLLADALGASVMGFSPRRLNHLAVAERAGLGSLDLSGADINKDWSTYKQHFEVRKTMIDRLSSLLFHSDALARLVMDSPLTPVIYKVASVLRSSEEREVNSQMPGHKRVGPY